ncbi:MULTISPECIES: hypothetical protein [unclassified Streptomyces]|uniref:hypothetical protein n=1 Tax=unclassified Streptomyces TaxID=2593676 RepID=UPI00343C7484
MPGFVVAPMEADPAVAGRPVVPLTTDCPGAPVSLPHPADVPIIATAQTATAARTIRPSDIPRP